MVLENMRMMSRLPHKVTWIEYDVRAERKRTLECYSQRDISGHQLASPEECCPRVGWLLEQNDIDENIFSMILFAESEPTIYMVPFTMVWSVDADDNLSDKIEKFQKGNKPLSGSDNIAWVNDLDKDDLDKNPELWSHLATGIKGYQSGNIIYAKNVMTSYFSSRVTADLLVEHAAELRRVFSLLACINDIPVGISPVRASKGFVAGGRYRKFLDHSVITLNLPKGREPRVVARRALIDARRRDHSVRGHWREDWRHPPKPKELCDHKWYTDGRHRMCEKFEGFAVWINEHRRGDPSLGSVSHEYRLKHDPEKV